MSNVKYRVLKSNIIKSCRQVRPNSMEFEVDFDKLKNLTADINLVPVCIGKKSKRVNPELIPYLSEYFEKSHLSWFTEGKYSTIITFVDIEALDERARYLLDKIAEDQTSDPDNDKVNNIATLVADYPCYFATIVSYQNNDPSRIGKPSYEIICRANKVVIKSSDYQYNPVDFS